MSTYQLECGDCGMSIAFDIDHTTIPGSGQYSPTAYLLPRESACACPRSKNEVEQLEDAAANSYLSQEDPEPIEFEDYYCARKGWL